MEKENARRKFMRSFGLGGIVAGAGAGVAVAAVVSPPIPGPKGATGMMGHDGPPGRDGETIVGVVSACLGPNDLLVLSIPFSISDETAERIKKHALRILDGEKVMVLCDGVTYSIIHRTPQGSMLTQNEYQMLERLRLKRNIVDAFDALDK